MDSAVAVFVDAATRFNATRHAEAEAYLQRLRDDGPSCVDLARAVLDAPAAPRAVKMHAAMLLRDGAARYWPLLPPDTRPTLRDWTMAKAASEWSDAAGGGNSGSGVGSTAAAGGRDGDNGLARMVVVACVVMWKRSWLEAEEGAKLALYEGLVSLLTADDVNAISMGVAVATTLVQEFGLTYAARPTALGATNEFHKAVALDMQRTLLPAMFAHVAALVTTRGEGWVAAAVTTQPPHATRELTCLRGALALLNDICDWDFSGRALEASAAINLNHTHSTGARMTLPLPATFGDAVMSPDGALQKACLAVYLASRLHMEHAVLPAVAASARQLLLASCAVTGALVSTPEAAAHHLQLHAALLQQLAQESLLLEAGAAAVAAAGVSDELTLWKVAYDEEANNIAVGFAILLRNHKLARLVAHVDVAAMLTAAHGLASRLVGELAATADMINTTIPRLRSQDEMSSLRDRVELLVAAKHEHITLALDSFFELWAAVAGEFGPLARLELSSAAGLTGAQLPAAVGHMSGGHGHDALPVSESTGALFLTARSMCDSLYAAYVRCRISLGSALIRLELDDTQQHEDASKFNETVRAVDVT